MIAIVSLPKGTPRSFSIQLQQQLSSGQKYSDIENQCFQNQTLSKILIAPSDKESLDIRSFAGISKIFEKNVKIIL